MQLENIGYARPNWNEKFVDTSVFFDFVKEAPTSNACGIRVQHRISRIAPFLTILGTFAAIQFQTGRKVILMSAGPACSIGLLWFF